MEVYQLSNILRDGIRGIDLVNNQGIIQIAYNARNLLTQANACGIVMLAPKV